MYYAGAGSHFIGRFMGYLHRAEESARDRVEQQEYDGNSSRSGDILGHAAQQATLHIDIEEFWSLQRKLAYVPDIEGIQGMLPPREFLDAAKPGALLAAFAARPAPPVVPPAGGGGGGGGSYQNAWYDEAGDDKFVEADQFNRMSDDDTFANHPGDFSGLARYDATDLVNAFELANQVFPSDLPVGNSTELEFMEWAGNRAPGEPPAREGAEDTQPLLAGKYLNGEKLPEESENAAAAQQDGEPQTTETGTGETAEKPAPMSVRPEIGEPTPYEQGVTDLGQVMEAGGNYAENVAQIVDVGSATPTMMVMGDWFKTNAIYQVNVYSDSDTVSRFGPDSGAIVETGGNVADNYAELDRSNPFTALEIPEFEGFFVHVDRVEGDFYDIRSLTQTNLLYDNDIGVQDSSSAYYHVQLGLNEQGNLFNMQDAFANYDVIIIGGSYHSANLIYQTNIVLDDDFIVMYAGEGSGSDQAIYAGQNWLFNSASIRDMSVDGAQSMDQALYNMCSRFGDEASYVNLEPAWGIAGNGSPMLNVLYIDGDFFDMNIISQINVITDFDSIVQYFGGDVEGFIQYLSSGHNAATNTAQIVTVGALDGIYVGGEVYEDSILIQANIVSSDTDQVSQNDPNGLPPEIVAFTSSSEEAACPDPIAWEPTPASAQQTDILAGTLH